MARRWSRLLLGVVVLVGCAEQQSRPAMLAGPMQPSHRRAAAQPEAARMVHLSANDVLGESVRLGGPDQKGVAVVFFMSRESKDESAELARAVDERLVDAAIDQVGIVDVHRYGGATRSLASWQLRKSAGEGRDRRRKRREEHHVDASAARVNRWHLIGDFDGALLKQFGVAQDLQHPVAFVVEPDGRVHGPYRDAGSVVGEVERIGASRASKSARNSSRSPGSSRRSASR